MVKVPEDWPWSSYITCISDEIAPPWLDTDWLLTQFGTQRTKARRAFQRFVMHGVGLKSPLLETRHQLLLGDENFIAQHQSEMKNEELREMSIAHRRTLALTLLEYQEKYTNRNATMARAYKSGTYKMSQIAEHFGVHYMTVSRAVRAYECSIIR